MTTKRDKPLDINHLKTETESDSEPVESFFEVPRGRPETTKGLAMSSIDPDPALLVARMGGAIAGALVSLVYLLPKSTREAVARGFAGLVSGLVFGPPTGAVLAEKFSITAQLGPVETMLMGSAAASMTAWWVLGALSRIADRSGRRPFDKD